jgi:hypothetical protein
MLTLRALREKMGKMALFLLGIAFSSSARLFGAADFTVGSIPFQSTSQVEKQAFASSKTVSGVKVLLVPNSALVSRLADGKEYGFLVDQVRIQKADRVWYCYFANIERTAGNIGRGNEMHFVDSRIINGTHILVFFEKDAGGVGILNLSLDAALEVATVVAVQTETPFHYTRDGAFSSAPPEDYVSSTVSAVKAGHQPWRLSPVDVVDSMITSEKTSKISKLSDSKVRVVFGSGQMDFAFDEIDNVFFVSSIKFGITMFSS